MNDQTLTHTKRSRAHLALFLSALALLGSGSVLVQQGMTALPGLVIAGAQASGLEVTSTGVGIGTATPDRQLHLKGDLASFRMDRPSNTAAFILVRTNSSGAILKTFVVGANASGVNNGEFIINDLGTATGGAGTRRFTIGNDGTATFTGQVVAPSYAQTSSIRFKENIAPIDAPEDLISRMRGVRFTWKDSGEPAIGFIAEEMLEVLPEAVMLDAESGTASAVNYAEVIPVLVEALKAQSDKLESLHAELTDLRAQVDALSAR